MKLSNALPDSLAFLVVPRAGADAITRIDRVRTLRTEVGMPCGPTAPGSGRERLAICVRTGQSAVVSAITFSNTGDEETHGLRWGLGRASAPDSQAARIEKLEPEVRSLGSVEFQEKVQGMRALARVRPKGSPAGLRPPLGTAWYLRRLGPALRLVANSPVSASDRHCLAFWEVAASAGLPARAHLLTALLEMAGTSAAPERADLRH